MGNSCGAVPSYDAVEMDDAARGRLVRALGVDALDLMTDGDELDG